MADALITTERLVLRPYNASMVTDEHVAWLNDPEVVKYSEQRHKTHTLESEHAYVNGIWKTDGNDVSYMWAITLKSPQKIIGTITAHLSMPNKTADVGIMIGDREQWGKAYGTEAWVAVCCWLRDMDIRKIEAGCMEANLGMQRVCFKAGMILEGRRYDHFMLNGAPVDLHLYAWTA